MTIRPQIPLPYLNGLVSGRHQGHKVIIVLLHKMVVLGAKGSSVSSGYIVLQSTHLWCRLGISTSLPVVGFDIMISSLLGSSYFEQVAFEGLVVPQSR